MQTYLVEVLDEKALPLLRNLEDLAIIRLLPSEDAPKPKLSERFRGSISIETAEKMHQHVETLRNEWDRSI